jgi:uncharacterized protein DUF6285
MQDRPTAIELLQAAQEFCERDLIPQLSGRVGFHARVLRNVLGILEREWEHEEDALRAEWTRLSELLDSAEEPPTELHDLVSKLRQRNAELASRIRAGDLDERWDETADALSDTVRDKLAIANPGYSETASSET